MSLQEQSQSTELEVLDVFLPPPTVSDTENDALDFNKLVTSPVVSVAPWLGINSTSKLWLHCECTYADGRLGTIELAEAVPVGTSTGAAAFSCELPLDELSKLGDNTTITIILTISTDGTMERQSLHSVRYSLAFQHPIVLTNYSRWMTDIGSDIEQLKIHDLILPEAHNAGVDQEGAGWPTDQWGACQDDTFTYQLRNGIRALDLRLYRDSKEMYTHKEYRFEHGSYHSRRYLNDCIHGVLEFAEQNPGEIVILDFHEMVLEGRESDVASTISRVLGNRCIPSSAKDLTIAQTRRRHPGRNVVIAWNYSSWYCWPKVHQTWTGDDMNDAGDLLRHINITMANPPKNQLWSIFAAGYNIGGPMRFKPDAVHWNSFFYAVRSDHYRQSGKGNMINVDFFAGTRAVDRCINATRERASKARLSTPTYLTTSNITTHSIKLRWLRPQDSETIENYKVFSNGTHVSTTSSTEHLFTGLNDGTTYHLQVVANFSSGDGAAAETTARTVAIPDTTKPSKPTDLSVSYFDNSTLGILSWSAATDNVAVISYEIYRNGTRLDIISSEHTIYPVNESNIATYKVRAVDAAGNFADSDPLTTGSDMQPPTKPTNLRATQLTDSTATLEWNASSDNVAVTGYQISRDNVPFASVTGLTYTALGLVPGRSYTFRVRALDAAGNFADSDPLTVTTGDTTAPTKPTNLRATQLTDSTATLEWNASSDNIAVTGYQISRDNVPLASVTGLTYTALGLVPGRPYTFRVRALDAAGNFADSELLTVTTRDTTAPTKPTNLRTTVVSFNFAILEWSRSSDNVAVTGYLIFRNGIPIGSVPESQSNYVADGLVPATTYSFKVRSLDAAGNFADSAPLTVTTPGATGPTKPTNLRTTVVSFNFAILEWSRSSDNVAVTGYQIFRNGTLIGSVTESESNYVANGLVPATTYSFKVRALDADGNFADSDPISVRTMGSASMET